MSKQSSCRMAALLVLVLTLVGLLPQPAAQATEPFALVRVTASNDGQAVPVTEGAVIPRNVSGFTLTFNHDLDFGATAGAVLWTDGTGADAQIRQNISYGVESNQTVYAPLKAGESYTLTIKGGPNGVKDTQGNTLAADITIHFKTDAGPLTRTVYARLGWDEYKIVQVDNFAFTATAGQFKLTTAIDGTQEYDVVLWDVGPKSADPDLVLWEGRLSAAQTAFAVNLSRASNYRLVVTPAKGEPGNEGRTLVITGPDLVMQEVKTPPLLMDPWTRFETHNAPFEVGLEIKPRISYPNAYPAAGSFKLIVDDKIVQEGVLPGVSNRIRIDPTTLTEGPHWLELRVRSAGSMNQSYLRRTLFVDRVDSFRDVAASHWARKPVEFMHDIEILSGQGDGLFAPDQAVTRVAFAKMLALTLHLPAPASAPTFADVPSTHWGKPYLDQLVAAGLLKGETVDGQTYLRPDRIITRAEAATIIGRVLGVANADLSKASIAPESYLLTDLAAIPTWAKPSVLVLHTMGWITGFPDGRFGPGETLSRAQGAKLLSRFLGL